MQGPFPAPPPKPGKSALWTRLEKTRECADSLHFIHLGKDTTAKVTTTFLSDVRQTTFMSGHVAFWCRYADDHDSY